MMRRYILIFLVIFVPSFSSVAEDSLKQLVRQVASSKLNLFSEQLLEPEDAFNFSAAVKNGNTLIVNWKIAPNYYLYREKIKLELLNNDGVKLGNYDVPNGLPKHDEAFGNVEIFTEDLQFDVHLWREDHNAQTIKLRAYFQGCAERGVCYPPMTKDVMLELPVAHQVTALLETTQFSEKEDEKVSSLLEILFSFSLSAFILAGLIFRKIKNSQ